MRRTAVPFLSFALALGCREQSTTTSAPTPSAAGIIATGGKTVDVTRTKAATRSVGELQRDFRVKRTLKRKGVVSTAMLTGSDVDHFAAAGAGAVVAVAGGHAPSAAVELPLESDGLLRVASGGLTIAAKPIGVARKGAEFAQQIAVYAEVQKDTTLYRRVDRAGTEDFFHVKTARDRVSYAYDVALTGVAGLRLVGGSLEMLDAHGAPRLATNAPTVFDANGVERTGTLSVTGCAYDTDPSGPWNRPVTAPGNDHCRVTYEVDTRGLAFPLLVDPAWVATATMKQTRAWHHLFKLPAGAKDGGKVLAVGGRGSANTVTMLYDIPTGTWATSGSLKESQGEGSNAVMFSDGSVLIAGGVSDAGTSIKSSAQIRNKTTGAWDYVAAMDARAYFAAGIVTIGGVEQAIVAGGYASTSSSAKGLKTAATYNPVTDTWTNTPALNAERAHPAGVTLTDGRFLLTGGETYASLSTDATDTTEVYDPAMNKWTAATAMSDPRTSHAIVAVPGGKALVAGGDDGTGYDQLDSVEYWSGTAWTKLTTKLSETKQNLVATALSDGRFLFAGGWYEEVSSPYDDFTSAVSDLVDLGASPPGTATVIKSSTLLQPRAFAAAVSLGTQILVTGGVVDYSANTESTSSEIYDTALGKACGSVAACAAGLFCTDGVCCKTATCGTGETCATPGLEGICTKPKGAACASSSECGTGFCVTGVCCDSACGECQSCNEPGSIGTCVDAKLGTDPKNECLFPGDDPGCGYTCNGLGSCGFTSKPAGTKCGASAGDAGTGFCESFACDGSGACEKSTPTCGLDCVADADCNATAMTCVPKTLKPSSCLIDGKCYAYADIDPADPCKQCDPVGEKFAWSDVPDCVDGGIVDTGAPDTGADDTGTAQDTGSIVDTGSAEDATTDTGTPNAASDLPEGQACSCDVPGQSSSSPLAALGVALGLALVATRRRR